MKVQQIKGQKLERIEVCIICRGKGCSNCNDTSLPGKVRGLKVKFPNLIDEVEYTTIDEDIKEVPKK